MFTGLGLDDQEHWQFCIHCGQQQDRQEHIFDSDCDTDCAGCSYTRQITHKLQLELSMDESGHWYVCQVCDEKQQEQAHCPGAPATEESAQLCTVCGYELAAKLIHVHSYAPYAQDEHYHWGNCVCGDAIEPQPHSWNINTGLCSVCGAEGNHEVQEQKWDLIWLAAFGVPVLGIVILLLTWIFRKRKKNAV